MDEKIRLFNEKKKSFDNIDGDEHLCQCRLCVQPRQGREAYLKGDAYLKGYVVELSFWYNKNCYPENFFVTLDDFLNKPLEDLPHWEYIQNYGWEIVFEHAIAIAFVGGGGGE